MLFRSPDVTEWECQSQHSVRCARYPRKGHDLFPQTAKSSPSTQVKSAPPSSLHGVGLTRRSKYTGWGLRSAGQNGGSMVPMRGTRRCWSEGAFVGFPTNTGPLSVPYWQRLFYRGGRCALVPQQRCNIDNMRSDEVPIYVRGSM